MGTAPRSDIGTTQRPVRRAARRSALVRSGLVVLSLGLAMLLAGGYRAAVELSEGRLHPVVPVAIGAPLAAELLLLLGVIVLAAAGLLIAASRQRQRR